MGRRTLRRIDPRIDLREYLYALEQFAVPYDMTSLFDHLAPLEIEVGSGKGLFLDTASAEFPDHNYLGIEVARRYARYTAARLARGQRTNARVLEGDAEQLFEQFLESDQVHAVHVYFPDPWPKDRHARHRLIDEKFPSPPARLLKPGGVIHLRPDDPLYFEQMQAVFCAHGGFESESTPLELVKLVTEFETDFNAQGKPTNRVSWRLL